MKETKVCTDCGEEKSRTEFHVLCSEKGWVQSKCKICRSKYQKKRYPLFKEGQQKKRSERRSTLEDKEKRRAYYKKNKDKIINKVQIWVSKVENKEKRREYQKEYMDKPELKEYRKGYYIKNKDKIKCKVKEYRKNNKDKYKARHQERRKTDPAYVIRHRLSCRLYNIVSSINGKGYKKESVLNLVGCDLETLKKHIENKFTDRMCWELFSEIHIDHIRPCAGFDLSNIEDQKKCFHYTNLQPLWSTENLSKGSKYNGINYRKSAAQLKNEGFL